MASDKIKTLRDHILALEAKLDGERMPDTKTQLRFALRNLDDYAKTGSVTLLQAAMDKYHEVVRAISRPPEKLY